ncbi:hypothetical protein ACF1AJ_05285 [Leifsonia sp. NPDC014704]|uniref:hypothetical protein n=1 Tax=Leifsonia sp. NPDC014704 TaxID=3364123 RepID=UPI0036F474CC
MPPTYVAEFAKCTSWSLFAGFSRRDVHFGGGGSRVSAAGEKLESWDERMAASGR